MDRIVKVGLLGYAACGVVWMIFLAMKVAESVRDADTRETLQDQLPPGYDLDDPYVSLGAAFGMAVAVAVRGLFWPYSIAKIAMRRLRGPRPGKHVVLAGDSGEEECECRFCRKMREDMRDEEEIPPADDDGAGK